MDIIGAISSINGADLAVFFGLFAMFILGFMQGVIRRLLGIASILISLLIGAQLRGPIGGFLAENWTQYSSEYNHMVAFGMVFLAGTVGATIALQLFFKPVPLFARYPVIDEIVGGLLGLIQGALILAAFYLITDPFFGLGTTAQANEFPFIRGIHDFLEHTITADVTRGSIVPFVLTLFGAFFSNDVKQFFVS